MSYTVDDVLLSLENANGSRTIFDRIDDYFRCRETVRAEILKIFAATCCHDMAIYVASPMWNEDAENVRLRDNRVSWQPENAEDTEGLCPQLIGKIPIYL